jgi:tetratricopeptide (TPR) repeat protein
MNIMQINARNFNLGVDEFPQEYQLLLLGILDDLSLIYSEQSRFEEAANLSKRALVIREGLPANFELINNLRNLAFIYDDLKRDEDADAFYERHLQVSTVSEVSELANVHDDTYEGKIHAWLNCNTCAHRRASTDHHDALRTNQIQRFAAQSPIDVCCQTRRRSQRDRLSSAFVERKR